MAYNVEENIAGTFRYAAQADYIMAFCGTEMYLVKSRGVNYETMNVPCKPDLVVAYYRHPEPHSITLALRGEYKESWCSMGHATGQRGCALCEEF